VALVAFGDVACDGRYWIGPLAGAAAGIEVADDWMGTHG